MTYLKYISTFNIEIKELLWLVDLGKPFATYDVAIRSGYTKWHLHRV